MDDYYRGSSSADSVPSVAVPLLCIQVRPAPEVAAAVVSAQFRSPQRILVNPKSCLVLLQARDDPIAPAVAIPITALEKNQNCILAITSHGGHLGWMPPDRHFVGGPWTDKPLFEFLEAVLARRAQMKLLAAAWLTRRLPRKP